MPQSDLPAANGVPRKVLLIGTLPPPIGGVSYHLRRLRDRLRALDVKVRVEDDSNASGLFLLFWLKLRLLKHLFDGGRLVHVHSGNWRTRCFSALLCRFWGQRCVLTIHSFRPNDNPWTKRLIRWSMKLARGLIVTNNEIRERCIQFGADPDRILVQHAYLDPAPAEGRHLPDDLLRVCKEHPRLIAANAFRLRMHEGQDLYGLDLLIELLHCLREPHPDLGLVFLLPEQGLPHYVRECRERIRQLGLERCFHLVEQKLEFVALLRHATLMIRPTNTDGDSLSVREALSLGVTTIASDVVERPPGTILFKNRDLKDLLRVTIQSLEKPAGKGVADQDGLAAILEFYRECASGR